MQLLLLLLLYAPLLLLYPAPILCPAPKTHPWILPGYWSLVSTLLWGRPWNLPPLTGVLNPPRTPPLPPLPLLLLCVQAADPDQPVMIYCTGGIRCDVYGTYLRKKG